MLELPRFLFLTGVCLAVLLLLSRKRIPTLRVSDCRGEGGAVVPKVETESRGEEKKGRVFFLELESCSAITLGNIVLREASERGLDVALPTDTKSQKYITSRQLPPEAVPTDGKYDVFFHYTRYNNSLVKNMMREGAVLVTMLRSPSKEYALLNLVRRTSREQNFSLELLGNTAAAARSVVYMDGPRRMGPDPTAWTLGLPPGAIEDSYEVEEFIGKLDKEFDLVLISEYLEPSLILLAEKLGLPLERLGYVLPYCPTLSGPRSDVESKVLRVLTRIDQQIYDFFLIRFAEAIGAYGYPRMVRDVNRLLTLHEDLSQRCTLDRNGKRTSKAIGGPGCDKVLSNPSDTLKGIKETQERRSAVLRALQGFSTLRPAS